MGSIGRVHEQVTVAFVIFVNHPKISYVFFDVFAGGTGDGGDCVVLTGGDARAHLDSLLERWMMAAQD